MSDELTVTYDLRALMPDVRDQGYRPLCLAFAASDLNSMSNRVLYPLSVEFLAYHAYLKEGHSDYDNGLTTRSVIDTLKHIGQPDETSLPYDIEADAPKVPPQSLSGRYRVHSCESFDFTSSIDGQLDKGVVTVACISLPDAFRTITSPFMLDEEDDHVGFHAVVVVGIGLLSSGSKYYLIRNSWGPEWGDKGHCWLSENFINKRTIALLEVSHLNESH
ncbi:C1 family peptidase [Rheinheimera sp. MM224]|uniref:C1 family peptidase n=1 Tax=Rheinheimera sp. MM224 TaxID=3019969 RepID=UPI0021F914C7|nr:C1 family peptidase [Rheinheimera sp. MM224]CAI3805408.1 hypothetical protein JAMGFMIE_03865 [Rheinheimera sp. MM224]